MTRLTRDQRAVRAAEIERLYREGASLKNIGLLLSMDKSFLSRILRARGVPMRPRGRPAGPVAPVAAAIADVLAGVPVTAAAQRHGLAASTLRRHLCAGAL